jgi:hypothetical protein
MFNPKFALFHMLAQMEMAIKDKNALKGLACWPRKNPACFGTPGPFPMSKDLSASIHKCGHVFTSGCSMHGAPSIRPELTAEGST